MSARARVVVSAGLMTLCMAGQATAHEDHARGGAPVDDAVISRAAASWRAQQQARRAIAASPLASTRRDGALAGKKIALSAGHGIFYDASQGAWRWQRAVVQTLREDIHTNQIAIAHLIPMIERAGGQVLNLRERSYPLPELLVDNDDISVGYEEFGEWATSTSPGYGGKTYRYAYVAPGSAATATWRFEAPATGMFPVYVYFLSSGNRSSGAKYVVSHVGGESTVEVDQSWLRPQSGYGSSSPPGAEATRTASPGWRYLGTFPMRHGESYSVRLESAGDAGGEERVVIADAVRVGAFESGITHAGATSGRPRWEEGALVHLEGLGAPAWLLGSDVTTRPLFTLYEGADLYFALHTNCCESAGTSSYTWYPEMWVRESAWPAGWADANLPPGTYDWSDQIHRAIIDRLRARWDSSWRDLGKLGANFGELRPIRQAWAADRDAGVSAPVTVPAVLVEAAFHDTADGARQIREDVWRFELSRAILAGMIRHVRGAQAVIPPLPPSALVAHATDGGVRVAWTPPVDPVEPTASPTGYRVYTSTDGLVFSPTPAADVSAAEVGLSAGPCETLHVKVTAYNAAGESVDSPVLAVTRRADRAGDVLWIDGVDRQTFTEADPVASRAIAPHMAAAVLAAGQGRGAIASATDDAVDAGLVELRGYRAVVWSLGETSTRDGALSAAQREAIRAYLSDGGRLIISGAEAAWALDRADDAAARAFFGEVLRAAYLADDADAVRVTPSANSPLAGMGSVAFGTCSGSAYCVEYPDALTPAQGAEALLDYDSGAGAAAVWWRDGEAGAMTFGFPIETIEDASTHQTLLVAALDTLAPELAEAQPQCEDDPPTEDMGNPAQDMGDPADMGNPAQDMPPAVDQDMSAPQDMGAAQDMGLPPVIVTDDGCGCRAVAPARDEGPLGLLALLAGVVGWRRRRRQG